MNQYILSNAKSIEFQVLAIFALMLSYEGYASYGTWKDVDKQLLECLRRNGCCLECFN